MIDKKVIAAIVAFCVSFTLATWRRSETDIRIATTEANAKAQIAIAERDNALQLAEQYKKQYQESLKEISVLKERLAVKTAPDEEIGWDFDYVVRVVGAEARGEPFDGILAVCQCIADTADRKGITPEQVVKAPSQYAFPISPSVTDGMEEVNEACLQVFINGYRPFDEPIEYFYAYSKGYSEWHESKVFCYQIGGHRYFKEG